MLTMVRLLSRVSSDVHGQCTALNKALAAAGGSTRVWTLIGVYPLVPLKV
jgi:hypothetical protein